MFIRMLVIKKRLAYFCFVHPFYSSLSKSVTFEVIQCEPASSVTSVVHSISCKRVSADNTTFVEWVTDFSNDATAEVVSDSSFKRLEAFNDLAARI